MRLILPNIHLAGVVCEVEHKKNHRIQLIWANPLRHMFPITHAYQQ